jgi:hypothetical protein
VRKVKRIIAICADYNAVERLHDKGFSYFQVFEMFCDQRQIELTPSEAREWAKKHVDRSGNVYPYKFAQWAGRNRMLITAPVDFGRLSDPSARAGFDNSGDGKKGAPLKLARDAYRWKGLGNRIGLEPSYVDNSEKWTEKKTGVL